MATTYMKNPFGVAASEGDISGQRPDDKTNDEEKGKGNVGTRSGRQLNWIEATAAWTTSDTLAGQLKAGGACADRRSDGGEIEGRRWNGRVASDNSLTTTTMMRSIIKSIGGRRCWSFGRWHCDLRMPTCHDDDADDDDECCDESRQIVMHTRLS